MKLGDFGDRKSMEAANARFVAALTGKSLALDAAYDPDQMGCGHSRQRHGFMNGPTLACRRCYGVDRRARHLPTALESTRAKLARLEREAREMGMIV